MEILKNTEPKAVMRFFEDICSIPHGSGNTDAISEYCVKFAKDKGLMSYRDDFNNVIIKKNASAGRENEEPLIIQGHLDMVCEKTPDCTIDFEKDGLTLKTDGNKLWADGTTLGGDDGIAVAYALALLDSDSISHPPLEAVFTVDEEIGMLGASALDTSVLSAKRMLNIDSEDEGVLTVSCAGGATVICTAEIEREPANGKQAYAIKIYGLAGGHSGVDINKGRANSNVLMGRLLHELYKTYDISIVSVNGGLKDNVIPNETSAVILSDNSSVEKIVRDMESVFQKQYISGDCGIHISIEPVKQPELCSLNVKSTQKLIFMLLNLPEGVQAMSVDIPGLVQTSLNMGILDVSEKEIKVNFSVRSSVQTEKELLISRLTYFMEYIGGKTEINGDYPAWEYKKASPLREVMTEVFEEQYGKAPAIEAIHAGLECGIFAGKINDLDCVSFGPQLSDIHTVNETMDIASVQRVWEYLKEVLKRI